MPANNNYNLRGFRLDIVDQYGAFHQHYFFFMDFPAGTPQPATLPTWQAVTSGNPNELPISLSFSGFWIDCPIPPVAGPNDDVRTYFMGTCVFQPPQNTYNNFKTDPNTGVTLYPNQDGTGPMVAQGDPNYRKPPVIKDKVMMLSPLGAFGWSYQIPASSAPQPPVGFPNTNHSIADNFTLVLGKVDSQYRNQFDSMIGTPPPQTTINCTVSSAGHQFSGGWVVAAGIFDQNLQLQPGSGGTWVKNDNQPPNLPYNSVMIFTGDGQQGPSVPITDLPN